MSCNTQANIDYLHFTRAAGVPSHLLIAITALYTEVPYCVNADQWYYSTLSIHYRP